MTKILCVPAGHLTEETSPNDILMLALQKGEWIERTPELEADETWRQIIPYVLLAAPKNEDTEEVSFFVYQRKGGGEGRLDRMHSIGVGGHIEEVDNARHTPVLDGAIREVTEEVKVPEGGFADIDPNPFMSIVINDNPVDRVHVGLVYAGSICYADESNVYNIEANEPELLGTMMTSSELKAAYNQETIKFEGWTKKVLAQM